MRLTTQIFEDARGRRSTRARLYLHGSVGKPLMFEALEGLPSKLVDTGANSPGTSHWSMVRLDVLALDNADDAVFAELFAEGTRADLLHTRGGGSSETG